MRDYPSESGLEEFIIWLHGDDAWVIARADHESARSSLYGPAIDDLNGRMVKAYAPADWQTMGVMWWFYECVIIGYRECRLTAEEEHRIRLLVSHYWELPF